MSETQNFGLYIEDDATETFLNWRKRMNGSDNSNMIKIDQALSKKGDKSAYATGTLLASAWNGVNAPFTQVIQVDGLGTVQNGQITVAQSATFEQREMAREAKLAVIAQSENTLTIAADGEMPDIDIPFVIIILG